MVGFFVCGATGNSAGSHIELFPDMFPTQQWAVPVIAVAPAEGTQKCVVKADCSGNMGRENRAVMFAG